VAWIVITVIAVLIGSAALFVGLLTDHEPQKLRGFLAFGGVVVVWLVLTGLFSVENIGARQVWIVYSFSGTIVGQRSSGTVFISPWDHVTTENIGLQRENFALDQTDAAVSSDQQPIYADLSLNYQVDPQHVLQLYKGVGPNWKAILLDSRVLQDFKEVTSGFTAEQITTRRQQLRVQTKSRLTTELKRYDITVVDFFVTNLDYTQTYKEAINNKNIQVQQALQAQAKVAQAKAEAAQAVAQANGRAQSTVLEAQADAKALGLKGQAIRQNPEILQLEAIDKLNPNAQVVICTGTGTGNCPSFIQTPNATSSSTGR
jgi:regulator of protease activity HflC (stomatin/prohibitin superfamily)